MKRTTYVLLALLITAFASVMSADTVDSVPFLATMLPSNEVPPTSVDGSANALVWVHVVRDNSGNITSGSVDFNLAYKFTTPTNVTGLHIHNGAAGTNGPILIPTDASAANPIVVDAAGSGRIFRQVQFPGAPNPTVATITDLLANPQNYYINLHTPENPGGAIRSQLARADMKVLMAIMSPANEVPPVTGVNSAGVSTVTVFRAVDGTGALSSALVTFDLNYTGFPSDTMFTGFHIHNGAAGTNGPVIINTGIGGGANMVPAGPDGSGSLHYDVAVAASDSTFPAESATVNGLFDNPNAFYINIHTVVNPGGQMRSQLRTADKTEFQVTMLPSNEVPPVTGMNVSGQAKVSLYSLRGGDGAIVAGTAIFDVNFRGFPAGTTFNGLHIHDGGKGVNGPVTINTGLSGASTVVTDSGSGNVYKTVIVNSDAPLATLTTISKNPENAYINMHTTVNPGGVIRSQLAAVNTALPVINAITSNPDTKTTTLAPGEIFTIYGTNLSKSTGDLSGTYLLAGLPNSLNGVSVTVGGKAAPLYYLSSSQINAQAPLDISNGSVAVVVTTPNGASLPVMIMVSQAAPAIYFDPTSGIGAILKNSDFSLVTQDNPATAGDIVLIYSTGLGQTTPPQQTGNLQPGSGLNITGTVSASIGGQNAPVVYSAASPGFAGLYQTAVTIPAGVTGAAKVTLKAGPLTSNAVTIYLK